MLARTRLHQLLLRLTIQQINTKMLGNNLIFSSTNLHKHYFKIT